MNNKRYLAPVDGRKSFYNKCYVITDDNGTESLYSYDTRVMSRDKNGTLRRHWNGYSATTQRHIAAFCGLNKKAFTAMPVEN